MYQEHPFVAPKLLCQSWEKGAVPLKMEEGNRVTLYMEKEKSNEGNGYRGVFLLGIVKKSLGFCGLRLEKIA